MRRSSVRGAVLTEAAIVIPIFIAIILGGISLFEILYTRSTVQFALQEGLRLAQNDPRLQVDIFSLDPSLPADQAKLDAYKTAREQLVSRTMALLNNRLLVPVTFQKSDIDGTAGDVDLDLALLPPNFSGRVGSWGRDVRNSHACTPTSVSVPDPLNPGQSITREVCAQTGSYITAIATYPTEFRAFADIKTPLFGTVHTEVAADAYLASAAASSPALNTPGALAGGYTLYFSVVGAGNGGHMIIYHSGKKWGHVTNVTVSGRLVPTCDAGFDTLHLSTQQKFASYTADLAGSAYGKYWANPLQEFPEEYILNGGASMGAVPVAQFLCLTR